MFGNLPPPPAAFEGVQLAMAAMKYNGYTHSSGHPEARQAVAEHYSTAQHEFSPEVRKGSLNKRKRNDSVFSLHTNALTLRVEGERCVDRGF